MAPQPITRNTALKIMRSFRNDPRRNLKEISASLSLPENRARVFFKRATGITFTEFVKRKRKRFILENQHLTNKEINDKLGTVPSVIMPLIRELKAEGKLRQTRLRATHVAAPAAFYMPSSLPLMRLMVFASKERGISVPELSQMTNMAKNNINRVLKVLLKDGYLKKGKKEGQRQYYIVTPIGAKWLRDREEEQVRRDNESIKYSKSALGVVRRREKENEMLSRLLRNPEVTNPMSQETITRLRNLLEQQKRETAIMRARLILK